MKKALENIRVLDITEVWSGPICAQYFADMGAEVIRVSGGDRARIFDTRRLRGDKEEPEGFSHSSIMRNRLGLSLDISKSDGADMVKKLVGLSDILIENSTPQTFPKFGLNYEKIKEINPTIVMISLSGAGQTGPWTHFPTYGPSLCALYGVSSLLGYPMEEWPREGASEADPIAGTFGFIASMAALLDRQKTGRGRHIDLSQGEVILSIAAEAILEYTMNGKVQTPRGNDHPMMAPHGMYPAKGVDKWISISVETQQEWEDLCKLMGKSPNDLDPSFSTLSGRIANRESLDLIVAEWSKSFDNYELMHLLQNIGIAAFPVLSISEQFDDPHLRERRMDLLVEDSVKSEQIAYGVPWKLRDTPGSIYGPAPKIGEHDEYVLNEILGVSSKEMDMLRDNHALG